MVGIIVEVGNSVAVGLTGVGVGVLLGNGALVDVAACGFVAVYVGNEVGLSVSDIAISGISAGSCLEQAVMDKDKDKAISSNRKAQPFLI